jgi:formate hydrogenlyase transcriptional activator
VKVDPMAKHVQHEVFLEKQRQILLDLGNDITRVREKNDLITLFSKRIKGLFYFTHTMITLIDALGDTYKPFLLDYESSPVRTHRDYRLLVNARFLLDEPFIESVLEADGPIVFQLKDTIANPQSPVFLRANYEKGVKEVLMMKLMNADKPIGFIHIYSDRTDSFTQEFKDVIKRISSQLSSAVYNIIKNEEIKKKEEEKSFLLDFSSDIAGIMTKADLETAVFKVLDRLLNTKLAMLRLIDDDGHHLSPYMFDKSLFEGLVSDFGRLSEQKITTDEYYTALVLKSREVLVLNVEEQLRTGNKQYAEVWEKTGFKNMYATVLKAGDQILGTIWMLADHISMPLFKGICAQISTAISNIKASEKISEYRKRLEDENDYLKEQISTIYNFSEIIGSGGTMQQIYRLISLVAESNSTVLILGETGTGKELVARAVHGASLRKDKLMIKVNCAAMPASLIESELFGHERGAFTGAVERRIGKFELANNSTLFLDEIGEMPMEAQVKLLRVLQEREMERVGGKTTIKLNVRVIAATNRNLEEEVKAGRFRSDLFYRLNVFPVKLPPLRDRTEDIEALTEFFVAKYGKNTGRKVTRVSAKVLQQLRGYLWPGNIRELEHVLERSVLLATDHTIREVYLPNESITGAQAPELSGNRSLEEVERSYIIEVLKRCSGKISGMGGAAEILGIPGNTLHSKMKKLQIQKADYFSN